MLDGALDGASAIGFEDNRVALVDACNCVGAEARGEAYSEYGPCKNMPCIWLPRTCSAVIDDCTDSSMAEFDDSPSGEDGEMLENVRGK